MPSFLLKTPPDSQGYFTLDPDTQKHLCQVLRIQAGDHFRVTLPQGGRVQAILLQSGQSLKGKIISKEEPPLPPLPLTMALGMIRWKNLEWLIEKGTELGLQKLCLLQMDWGSLPKSQFPSQKKLERLKKISEESLKQCERAQAIQIKGPSKLEEWLNDIKDIKVPKFFLSPRGRGALPQKERLVNHSPIFLIGPEGGISPHEESQLNEAGFEEMSFGPGVYQSETAALYAMALINHFSQDDS